MSEQVGYINNLDLQEINDKFRIIQNLFDGIIFNDTHLKDYQDMIYKKDILLGM